MKITIDPAACDGFGFCAEILPEALTLDEWGFPIVREGEVPERLMTTARKAVKFCPRRALTLTKSVKNGQRKRVRAS